eukprot:1041446-Prymnesium_polylepis.3
MEELWWACVVEIWWKIDDLRVWRGGVLPARNGAVCLLSVDFGAVLAAVTNVPHERSSWRVAPVRWPCTRSDACDDYSWTTACPMDTMASGLAANIQEKVLCQWGGLQVPFTHVRPPDTRPSQCSMPTRAPFWGTISGQSAPNPMRCVSSCCQPSLSSPLDGMQANGKPLVSSTHALPPLWCMGQTGPRWAHEGRVRRLCGAGVKTEAPRQ